MAADLIVKLIIKAIDQASAPIRAVTNNFEKFKAARKSAEKMFEKSRDMNQAAEAVSRFAAGTRRLIDLPLKTAEDFEQAMAEVAAVSNSSNQELKDLTATARKLGAETVFSAREAASGLFELSTAGYAARAQIAAIPGVLNLAAAGKSELAAAAAITTSVMAGFKLEASEAGRVADVLTDAINRTKTNLTELGYTMSYAAVPANALHLSLEETTAMAGVLAEAGVAGSKGGTALAAVLSRLANPRREQRKVLKFLDVSMFDRVTKKARPIVDVLSDINRASSKLSEETRFAALGTLFGQEALDDVLSLLSAIEGGRGKLVELTAAFKNSGGAAAKMATQMNATTTGAGREMESALESLNISIGNAALPALKSLRLWVRDVAVSIDRWVNEYPNLVKWIVITLGVMAILGTILAALIVTVATATAAIGVFAVAMGSSKTGTQILGLWLRWLMTGGLKRFAITLVTQSIPAAIRFAVTLVRRAAVAVATFAMSLIRQGIPAVARFALALLVRAVPAVIAFLVQMVAMAAGVAGAAVPALVALTLKFVALGVAMLATPIGWIILGIAALIAAVVLIYKNWGPISEWFAKLWEGIKEAFTSAITWISTKLDELLESAKSVGRTVSGFFGGDDSPTVTAPQLGDAQQSLKLGPARELIAGRGMEGELHIKIDSAQPVSVRRMESTGLDLDVDAGPAMVGV